MKQKNKFSKALYILIFLLIIFLSELIHILNYPSRQVVIYIKIAQLTSQQTNIQTTLNLLHKAAAARIQQLNLDYEDIDLPPPSPPPSINNKQLLTVYKNTLDSTNFVELKNKHHSSLSKLYYQLGLKAYYHHKISSTIFYWQTASLLAPEWSYPQVELANLRLQLNQPIKAQETLAFCQKFESPKEHCQDFINHNLTLNYTKPIGFLEELIDQKM